MSTDVEKIITRDWLWKRQVDSIHDREAVRAAHKQFNQMERFAGDLFKLLCVRSSSVSEAIALLYITGLHHGDTLGRKL